MIKVLENNLSHLVLTDIPKLSTDNISDRKSHSSWRTFFKQDHLGHLATNTVHGIYYVHRINFHRQIIFLYTQKATCEHGVSVFSNIGV